MDKKDAKVGMTVVMTGVNNICARWDDRYLSKGDKIVIQRFEDNSLYGDGFRYATANGGLWFIPLSEVQPYEEQKMTTKTNWYVKVPSKALCLALDEIAKKSGYFVRDLTYEPTALLSKYGTEITHSSGFGEWEKEYEEITVDEAIKILSTPLESVLTIGGKLIEIKDNYVVISGEQVPIHELRKVYNVFKGGPIKVGKHFVEFYHDDETGKYEEVVVGCTKATAEEIEALAKKLRF